jgi:hypothetical protein
MDATLAVGARDLPVVDVAPVNDQVDLVGVDHQIVDLAA